MITNSRTPAEAVERLLTRWRVALPTSYSSAYIDGFIARNRTMIEGLVTRILARRKAERGDRPETVEEFAAYDPIAAREQPRSAGSSQEILVGLMKRIDADLREGYHELMVLNNLGLEYIHTHAEAILLRNVGWDAVPLLIQSPALAIVAGGSVIAVRDSMGGLSIHPHRGVTLNHLFGDLSRAEAQLLELSEELPAATNTKQGLAAYAEALWPLARAALPRRTPRLPDP